MKITKVLLGILATTLFLVSCSDDDSDMGVESPLGNYDNGIIVSNEGPFQSGSGSTSFVSFDLETVENEIYNNVNNEQLGSVQQSIGFNGEDAYIIVDGIQSITRVNKYTFEKQNEIVSPDLFTPRFIAFSDTKGYVSNWGDTSVETDDFIAVLNLETQEVEATIPVDLGPEQLVTINNKLYVSHKGAFDVNNIISVIDLDSNQVITTIETGYAPDELVLVENELWVAVSGGQSWNSSGETISSIAVIDINSDTVSKTLEFEESIHIGQFSYEDDTIYYTLGNDIYALNIEAETLPTTPIVTATSLYGLSVNDGKIYTTDANGFTANGFLNIYDPAINEWSSSVELGIGPSKIYFNE